MIKAWCRVFTSLKKTLVEVSSFKAWFRTFTSVNNKRVKVCDDQSFRVLVLPVHSRETRHVSFLSRLISFLSRRVSRGTRCVSRDGGNLHLSGTVVS